MHISQSTLTSGNQFIGAPFAEQNRRLLNKIWPDITVPFWIGKNTRVYLQEILPRRSDDELRHKCMLGEMDAMSKAMVHVIDEHIATIRSEFQEFKMDQQKFIEHSNNRQREELDKHRELGRLESEKMRTVIQSNMDLLLEAVDGFTTAALTIARVQKANREEDEDEERVSDDPSLASDEAAESNGNGDKHAESNDLQVSTDVNVGSS